LRATRIASVATARTCSGAKAPQLLAKATQGSERALLRGMVENSLSGQAGSKANTLFEVVKRMNLIANDAPKLQAKAVGTQIDAGN
jgi:hypothetical protein